MARGAGRQTAPRARGQGVPHALRGERGVLQGIKSLKSQTPLCVEVWAGIHLAQTKSWKITLERHLHLDQDRAPKEIPAVFWYIP